MSGFRVVSINTAKGVITLEPTTEEVAMSWQDDFCDTILHGGTCPCCGGEIARVDYNGYTWRCALVRPSGGLTMAGTPQYVKTGMSHTGLDFIRVMYPKQRKYHSNIYQYEAEKRGWTGWGREEKKEPETENEFGPIVA